MSGALSCTALVGDQYFGISVTKNRRHPVIDLFNSFTVPDGKRADAVELLKKVAAMHQKHLPEMNSRVMTPTTGAWNRAFLVLTFESHQQREEQIERLHADPEWNTLIKEIRETGLTTDREVDIYRWEE
jgi:hypothetical protein